ncbi:hypothetical protein [Streptomyces sp. 142MFCol3.1]|nr:hypothetical protein [Streptomyces sp. 142MFCol3.1]
MTESEWVNFKGVGPGRPSRALVAQHTAIGNTLRRLLHEPANPLAG